MVGVGKRCLNMSCNFRIIFYSLVGPRRSRGCSLSKHREHKRRSRAQYYSKILASWHSKLAFLFTSFVCSACLQAVWCCKTFLNYFPDTLLMLNTYVKFVLPCPNKIYKDLLWFYFRHNNKIISNNSIST